MLISIAISENVSVLELDKKIIDVCLEGKSMAPPIGEDIALFTSPKKANRK